MRILNNQQRQENNEIRREILLLETSQPKPRQENIESQEFRLDNDKIAKAVEALKKVW